VSIQQLRGQLRTEQSVYSGTNHITGNTQHDGKGQNADKRWRKKSHQYKKYEQTEKGQEKYTKNVITK
jgi:hypothetical protein